MNTTNRLIALTVATIIGGFSACADQTTTNASGKVRIPKERLNAMMQRANMKLYGGKIRKEGSAKGCFAVVNCQKLVGEEALKMAAGVIDKQVRVNVAIANDSGVTLSNVKDRIRAKGGVNGVAIVCDDTLPGFLSAPEDGWCIVNVKKLASDNPDAERLALRVRKEVLRAFAFVNGGAYAAYGDMVMGHVKCLGDLDALSPDGYGAMLLNLLPMSCRFYGLDPWHECTYRKACEEGWAPAPTNEYQKAIWDKVHALPTEPIKIKPETKKVTE